MLGEGEKELRFHSCHLHGSVVWEIEELVQLKLRLHSNALRLKTKVNKGALLSILFVISKTYLLKVLLFKLAGMQKR